ncbi:cell division ATP-binding protein FtsE [Candidatus Woesebacteria bacterium]|nr:MAG: cell division ATP-binding protein FtsE [Candidatus Woesebacteria bacterium]
MISLKGVTKTFGKITAIEDATFAVDKGEFVFLTGPSGAGKTTILKLILREYLPDKGKILFEGKNIVQLPDKFVPSLRQQIGVVFQDFKLLSERTVRENVEVALAVKEAPLSEWKKRVRDVLELVGLIERSQLFPSQLSGGELQRVSLARALVINPKIILADEPTGNLDWETADELMDLFEKISKEGKTVIMATHHRGIVDKLKKREIKIDKGKIVGGGESPKKKTKLKEKPAEKKVEKEKTKVKAKVEEAEEKKE